jgi:tetratricopeptide (TPR) repeat protein
VKPNLWRRTKLFGKQAFAVAATLSSMLVAVWILTVLIQAAFQRNTIDLGAINVPKKLADDGFSTDIATRRLRDAIKDLHGKASTTMAKADTDGGPDLSGITIPGAGISLQSIAASLRSLLPENWRHEVSGEFTMSGTELFLRLRLNRNVVFDETVETATNPKVVTVLINRAAFRVVEKTQPFIAASALYSDKKFDEAGAKADEIIRSGPEIGDGESVNRAYNLKGVISRDKGRTDEAVTFFRKAPSFAAAHSNLGLLLHGLGKPEEAEAAHREAIRLDPNYTPAHNNLGTLLHARGRLEEAGAAYREAIRLDPRAAPPHNNLGWLVHSILVWLPHDKGKPEEAEAAYREAIRLDPNYVLAHINLGWLLHGSGRLEEAEAAYREVIRLDPNYVLAHINLAALLRDRGRVKEAEVAFNEARRFRQEAQPPR